MWKSTLENKLRSQNFLLISCAAIFFFSIFLRSLIDIGSDTGVYINLGKKFAHGGRYYFDFFESNFPLSFYFYALQYQVSVLLHISPIILSEIVINLLALSSIFWSAKILKNTTIYDNKAHYNIIIFSYFLGFFLRPIALEIGEFGTKSSLLLIALYPYVSYSFARKSALTRKDLIYRGLLMGVIPCLKPHYLVLIIFIELRRFFKGKKFLHFFCETDKSVMFLVGIFYLSWMMKFTPEFFEFIVPMWQKIYYPYYDLVSFLENLLRHIGSRFVVFGLVFLIFSRLKFDENDQVLGLLFIGVTLLIIIENIGSVDQIAVFFSVITIYFCKFLFDFFSSREFVLLNNKFIVGALFLIPASDPEIMPAAIFGLGGIVNIWWLVLPFYLWQFMKKNPQKFDSKKYFFFLVLFYFLMLAIAVAALKYSGGWTYISCNLLFLFLNLFYFEKKINSQNSKEFSPLAVFVIVGSLSCLFYSYVSSISNPLKRDSGYSDSIKLADPIVYYSKKFGPKPEDEILISTIWIAHRFPILNYLKKEDHEKAHVAAIQANKGLAKSRLMFPIKDLTDVFTISYLLDDMKNQMRNPQTKIFLVNNTPKDLGRNERCLIGSLEYYFLDPEFKKLFFKNFRFENHLIITKEVKPVRRIKLISGEEKSIFDQVKPTTNKVIADFEVYVRKN